MGTVFDCLVRRHDVALVFLALAQCVFSMATAMYMLARVKAMTGRLRIALLMAAACVAGGGVWSTHFVAMLSYNSMPLANYDVARTALSAGLAIVLSAAGYLLCAYLPAYRLVGGALCGVAIGAMHYVGMAALEVPANFVYAPSFVTASLLIGVSLAAFAYLVIFASTPERVWWRLPLATAGGVGAVAGLHFTAMAGLTLVPDPVRAMPTGVVDPTMLGIMIAAATVLIAAIALMAALFDAHLKHRMDGENARLRAHVIELDETRQKLEATTYALSLALETASAGSAAKSRFLATMSHELRTPLNAIIGFAEVLQNMPDGPLEQTRCREYAGVIRHSGLHLLSMIKDVLDLTHLDSGHVRLIKREIDTESLICDAIELVAMRAEMSNIRVRHDVAPDACTVTADAERARQVLTNLLSNSVKFTPEGGTIDVVARAGEKGVAITVRDNGIGIAPEHMERVLERFGQADNRLQRRYEGSGLGLSLSKDLVELHGGTLRIESTPGRGTAVTVTFPVGSGSAAATSPLAEAATESGTLKIA